IEQYLEVGYLRGDKAANPVFVAVSMNETTAKLLIHSPQFKKELPQIQRLLNVQIPVLLQDKLVFPNPGHDERFKTFTDQNCPKILPVTLDFAHKLIGELFSDFPFDSEQSRVHAIARLITRATHGLMGWT